MKLIKAILSCAVMLSSISFGAPTNSVTNQQFEKWLEAPVHGGVNFGPVSLSNYEADKTDLGRARWWRKEKGILSSALVGFFTVAAALFLTFLILQCFQKLQQHRDLTSSMRQLADGKELCVNLDADDDDDDDEEADKANQAIVLFDANAAAAAAAAAADAADAADDKNEIFFIDTGRGRGRGRGRRDNRPWLRKFLALLMMAMAAFAGIGGGIAVDKAFTDKAAITNNTFFTNPQLRGTLFTNAFTLGGPIEGNTKAAIVKQVVDNFEKYEGLIEGLANEPKCIETLANEDKFAETLATGLQKEFKTGKTKYEKVKQKVTTDLVKEETFAAALVEQETFANEVIKGLKDHFIDPLADTKYEHLKNKLKKNLLPEEEFVNDIVTEDKFVGKLVDGLQAGFANEFANPPHKNYTKLASKVKELSKEEKFVGHIVDDENFAGKLVEGLTNELDTTEKEAGTKYRKFKNKLVKDTRLLGKLSKDENFKTMISDAASKRTVVDTNSILSILNEKVDALQTALRTAAQQKPYRIKYRKPGDDTTPKGDQLVNVLPPLGRLPHSLTLVDVQAPDFLPGLRMPHIRDIGPLIKKLNTMKNQWNNVVKVTEIAKVDEGEGGEVKLVKASESKKIKEIDDLIEKLVLHANDIEKLLVGAHFINYNAGNKWKYRPTNYDEYY